MHITRQGGDVSDTVNMLLAIQHRLIQMGNGPALGDIEAEKLRQLCSGLSCDGVLPGAEGDFTNF